MGIGKDFRGSNSPPHGSPSRYTMSSVTMSFIEENKVMDMLYSNATLDPNEKYKKVTLPHDKLLRAQLSAAVGKQASQVKQPNTWTASGIAELNHSEKERMKKHLALFKKLKNILQKHPKNSLFYIRTFMARVLQVPALEIPEMDVHKFMQYIESEKIPNPQLNIAQIIL